MGLVGVIDSPYITRQGAKTDLAEVLTRLLKCAVPFLLE